MPPAVRAGAELARAAHISEAATRTATATSREVPRGAARRLSGRLGIGLEPIATENLQRLGRAHEVQPCLPRPRVRSVLHERPGVDPGRVLCCGDIDVLDGMAGLLLENSLGLPG